MTTATREDRWRNGRHLASPGIYLYLAATAALPWFPRAPFFLALAVNLAAIGIVIATMRHARELCERCIAAMPLDPDAAVGREHALLKLCHRAKRLAVGLFLLIIAGALLPRSWWESSGAISLSMALAILLVLSANRHSRLQPWCPYCHRGDGGEEFSDAPEPSDGHRKPIPA